MSKEREKVEMTEKQFEELCQAVYPHLKAIQNVLSDTKMPAIISIADDGYISFHPCSSDWEFVKFKDSQAVMKYEHRIILEMEENE